MLYKSVIKHLLKTIAKCLLFNLACNVEHKRCYVHNPLNFFGKGEIWSDFSVRGYLFIYPHDKDCYRMLRHSELTSKDTLKFNELLRLVSLANG